VRITEAAAISAAHWMGHGDNNRADEAAVTAMRKAMDEVAFHGTVVIGEGEPDEAADALIGEQVGRGEGRGRHRRSIPRGDEPPSRRGARMR